MGGVCVLGVGCGCLVARSLFCGCCGHLCLWASLFVVIMGSCHRLQCGRSSSLVMCLDGGGKEKRNTSCCQTNIVCYP